MSELAIELSMDEAEALRALLGASEPEVRELRLVDRGRLLQSVRTDVGPARAATAIGTAVAMRARRAITVEAAALSLEPELPLAFDAIPPWIPALDAVSARLRWMRIPARRLLPDGAYGLSVLGDGAPVRTICCRVRAGRLERLVGGQALGLDPEAAGDPAALAELVRRRIGRPVAVAIASLAALRELLESRRPVTLLERVRIRGEIRPVRLAVRLGATLLALRLLGL